MASESQQAWQKVAADVRAQLARQVGDLGIDSNWQAFMGALREALALERDALTFDAGIPVAAPSPFRRCRVGKPNDSGAVTVEDAGSWPT